MAEDNDNTRTDGAGTDVITDVITYDLEGPDAKFFTVSNDDGTLGKIGFNAALSAANDSTGADFEGKPSYSLTIVAISADATEDMATAQ